MTEHTEVVLLYKLGERVDQRRVPEVDTSIHLGENAFPRRPTNLLGSAISLSVYHACDGIVYVLGSKGIVALQKRVNTKDLGELQNFSMVTITIWTWPPPTAPGHECMVLA